MFTLSPAMVIWLILLVVFFIAEAATVTLVSLWFAAGSLGALITSMLGGPLWLQVAVFLALSLLCIGLLRPITRKHFSPRIVPTNIDALVGRECFVTEDIDNLAPSGQVKLGSMPWTARSSTGEAIPTGTQVKVDKIEGVKAFVSPIR